MFVGHYAVGFILKKKFKEIQLWYLFIAVQFVDILAFIFVLSGIERISYNPTSNPFLRTALDYVPFTHSLLSSLILAVLVFFIFWKLKAFKWGVILSLGVLSHWILDFIAHTPDLPLIWTRYKVGLGLWSFPWIAFILEVSFFIAAGTYLYRGSKTNMKRAIILITAAVILYAPTMFAPEKEAPVAAVCLISLSLYALFSALAFWSEKTVKNETEQPAAKTIRPAP